MRQEGDRRKRLEKERVREGKREIERQSERQTDRDIKIEREGGVYEFLNLVWV